jgi:MFS family permease
MSHLELPQDISSQDLAGAGNVFRNRSFVLLWTAQLLSQLASNMVLAALMATVVSVTGSNTANAVLILTFLVPAVAFSAVAGVFVERSDARLIMIASNVLRAALTVLFIFVGTHVGLILFINLFIATVTAFFAPAELTAIPRIVGRTQLMAANSVFVLTVNATFAIGFGFLGPLLLTTAGANVVFVVVAVMFGLAAAAIIPLPSVRPEKRELPAAETAVHALRAVFDQVTEGIQFVRDNRQIAWSLAYLGIAASLIGVMGAIGPGFATDILRLRPEDFFFIMGPAGLGAVIGILFLNAYGRGIPRRLVIDLGLVAMGVTLIGLALVKPITTALGPALQPLEQGLPDALAPIVSVIALVVVIAVTAGIEYAFVAIPSQTALQEELPVGVRGRIFGILNTLLSVASFLPVLIAPAAADLLNLAFDGAGIPVVMGVLGLVTLYAGIRSWRHNAASGLHGGSHSDEPAAGEPTVAGAEPAVQDEVAGGGRRAVAGEDAE